MLHILFAVVFCISLVIAPIALIRILTARTPRAYLQNIALFVVSMLATFGLAQISGFIGFSAPPKNIPPPEISAPVFSREQAILLALAACIWICGGIILMYRHTRRMGRSFWSTFSPLKPAFRDFNGHEWITFAVLAVAALALGALAIFVGQTR